MDMTRAVRKPQVEVVAARHVARVQDFIDSLSLTTTRKSQLTLPLVTHITHTALIALAAQKHVIADVDWPIAKHIPQAHPKHYF